MNIFEQIYDNIILNENLVDHLKLGIGYCDIGHTFNPNNGIWAWYNNTFYHASLINKYGRELYHGDAPNTPFDKPSMFDYAGRYDKEKNMASLSVFTTGVRPIPIRLLQSLYKTYGKDITIVLFK